MKSMLFWVPWHVMEILSHLGYVSRCEESVPIDCHCQGYDVSDLRFQGVGSLSSLGICVTV